MTEISIETPRVVVIPDGAKRWIRTTVEFGVTRHFVSLTEKEPSMLSDDEWVEDIEKRCRRYSDRRKRI